MSNFEDHLWQEFMTEHGDGLARMSRPTSRHARSGARLRVAVVGAVAVAAVAVGLTGVRTRAPAVGTIKTASFTLHKNANGTATLTINPKELLEPDALQSDLAQYRIPAKVTAGSFCSSNPPPAGFSQVVTEQPTGPQTVTPQPVVKPTVTIDPSAMPSGAELSIGDFQLADGEQQANAVLMNASSYTCTSTPP
ncbi:MAG: hypothetical protein ACRDNS_25920, partial [Trebonia sp.]